MQRLPRDIIGLLIGEYLPFHEGMHLASTCKWARAAWKHLLDHHYRPHFPSYFSEYEVMVFFALAKLCGKRIDGVLWFSFSFELDYNYGLVTYNDAGYWAFALPGPPRDTRRNYENVMGSLERMVNAAAKCACVASRHFVERQLELHRVRERLPAVLLPFHGPLEEEEDDDDPHWSSVRYADTIVRRYIVSLGGVSLEEFYDFDEIIDMDAFHAYLFEDSDIMPDLEASIKNVRNQCLEEIGTRGVSKPTIEFLDANFTLHELMRIVDCTYINPVRVYYLRLWPAWKSLTGNTNGFDSYLKHETRGVQRCEITKNLRDAFAMHGFWAVCEAVNYCYVDNRSVPERASFRETSLSGIAWETIGESDGYFINEIDWGFVSAKLDSNDPNDVLLDCSLLRHALQTQEEARELMGSFYKRRKVEEDTDDQ